MNSSFVEQYNKKEAYERWYKLPGRIFLDTNVLQYLQDFGEFIFEECTSDKDYFVSPRGKIIKRVDFLYSEIIALHEIFKDIDRANFEFAVSKNIHEEVLKKNDPIFLRWFYDILEHWNSVKDSYENPFSGNGIKLYEKARRDISVRNNLSTKDRQIFFDALKYECNAILTCDKYRNMQNYIYENYEMMILYPSDFIKILSPFQNLYR